MDDLLSLLNQRDLKLQDINQSLPIESNNQSSSHSSIPVENKSVSETAETTNTIQEQLVHITTNVFPSYEIVDVEEDWDQTMEEEDEDDGPSFSTNDPDHVRRLVDAYLQEEEDIEHANYLKELCKQQDQPRMRKQSSQHPTQEDTQCTEDNEDENELEKDEESMIQYKSSSSNSYKKERYFQKRVSVCPNQILRYAFGGEPLWMTDRIPRNAVPLCKAIETIQQSSNKMRSNKKGQKTKNSKMPSNSAQQVPLPPPPQQQLSQLINVRDIDIPNCEICGANRMFEFQLMPNLLNKWQCTKLPMKVSTETESEDNVSVANELPEVDFGVIAVWSCAVSCEPPDNSIPYEYVVVQPPLDAL
jgi:hypothetical protein